MSAEYSEVEKNRKRTFNEISNNTINDIVSVEVPNEYTKKLKIGSQEEQQDNTYQILEEAIDDIMTKELPHENGEETPLEIYQELMADVIGTLDSENINNAIRLHAINLMIGTYNINKRLNSYLPFSLGYCLIFLCNSLESIKATLSLLQEQGFNFNSPDNISLLEVVICLRNREINITDDNCIEIISHLVKKCNVEIKYEIVSIARDFGANDKIVSALKNVWLEKYNSDKAELFDSATNGKWPLSSAISLRILGYITDTTQLTVATHTSKLLWSYGRESLFCRIEETIKSFIKVTRASQCVSIPLKEKSIDSALNVITFCAYHKTNTLECLIHIEEIYKNSTDMFFRYTSQKVVKILTEAANAEFMLKCSVDKIKYTCRLLEKLHAKTDLAGIDFSLALTDNFIQCLTREIPANNVHYGLIQVLTESFAQLLAKMAAQTEVWCNNEDTVIPVHAPN